MGEIRPHPLVVAQEFEHRERVHAARVPQARVPREPDSPQDEGLARPRPESLVFAAT